MRLEYITEQNPWWVDKNEINRDEKVNEAASKKHRIEYSFKEEDRLVVGPRQVGKTTFLKLFIKHLIEKGGGSEKNSLFLL